MVELQAHYLALIDHAIGAAGGSPLLRMRDAKSGVIYVTRAETTTKADHIVTFAFDLDQTDDVLGERADFAFIVEFSDGRPRVLYRATYADGLDEFFPRYRRALTANRITSTAS